MPIRRRLPQLLLASHLGLVLLFALLVLATAYGTIRSAVVAQARSEAERSVSEARRRLIEWQRELTVGADLLAEQPTLSFYLQRGQLTKARDLVADFHATSDIDYVRVQVDERVVVEVGARPPSPVPGLVFDAGGQPWRAIRRQIPNFPSATVLVAERLGNRMGEASGGASVHLRLQPLHTAVGDDPWTRAQRQVSQSGEPETLEDVGDSAAARVVALRDEVGRPSALLSARVDRDWLERRILEWYATFGLSSLLALGLALAVAIVVSTRIGRPFAALAQDAERLGQGDLDTPVATPDTTLVEPVALAGSLEQMRRRVATLTTEERSQREELDAVLDGVDEGIVGADREEIVHYANRQFLALVGREREQIIGRSIDSAMLPSPHPPSALPDVDALERYSAIGSLRPLVVRRRSASGDRQVLVVREENAIEAARAMRDRILANLSHEFQTPLSAQMASIELLRDHLRGGGDPIAAQLADAQYRGTMRLSQLVDNLLESVRIESGELRLRRQPVDLPAVVADAIELIQPLLDQREQRVLSDLPAGPTLVGDSQRLFSVVVNLLANANKFAPDRSSIRVELEWKSKSATLWVEDEGPGLPTMHAGDDLFAPFRRAPDEEPSQRGTGLGLAIVKAIALAHGGDVVLAAPRHGRAGARFGVLLPLEPPCAS